MGTKPRHRCIICHTGYPVVRYIVIKRGRGQRRFKYFCSGCESGFLDVNLPSYIPRVQGRMYIAKKYGYKIQEEAQKEDKRGFPSVCRM